MPLSGKIAPYGYYFAVTRQPGTASGISLWCGEPYHK